MLKKNRYTGIEDMPVSVFHEIAATGRWELIGKGCGENDWARIFDSFLVRFGYLEDYARIPRLKLEAAKHWAIGYTGGPKWHFTMAQVKEQEIQMIIASEQGGSSDIWAAAATLSKEMGFRINPTEVSVAEFYSYIRVKK